MEAKELKSTLGMPLTKEEFNNAVIIKSGKSYFSPCPEHTITFCFPKGTIEVTRDQLEDILRNQTVRDDLKYWGLI